MATTEGKAMEMQHWQSEQVDQIAAAIVKAQKALKPAAKDSINPHFQSKYADLGSVWAALSPFTDNGIAIVQCPMQSDPGHAALDTQLTHVSGQWMRSRITMPVPKDNPQCVGSAITYARRYALGCMTGLVTEEDDDANAAQQAMKKQPMKKAPAQLPTVSGAAESVAQPPVTGSAPNYGVFIWQYGPKYKGFQIVDIPYSNLEWFSKNEKTPEDHRDAALMELDRRDAAAQMAGQNNG